MTNSAGPIEVDFEQGERRSKIEDSHISGGGGGGGMDSLERRVERLETRMDSVVHSSARIEGTLGSVNTKLDSKPNTAAMWGISFTVVASTLLIAFGIATVIIRITSGF